MKLRLFATALLLIVALGVVAAEPPSDGILQDGGSYNFVLAIDLGIGDGKEGIDITNAGSRSVDMTGWQLHDEGRNHTFTFPNGYTLAQGATVTVTSGDSPVDNPPRYLRGWTRFVWNHTGAKAYLRDRAGNLIASESAIG